MQAKMIFSLFIFWSLSSFYHSNMATSDPQTQVIAVRCSPFHFTNYSAFFTNLNAAISSLQLQLQSAHFATAQHDHDQEEVFSMAHCSNYLSISDCFSSAAAQIRNCSPSTNARVFDDGCFLRYQKYDFFKESTDSCSTGFCGLAAEGCGECLHLAYENIKECLPSGDGRGIDEGYFLRFSDAPFFSENQTTDITTLLIRNRKGALFLLIDRSFVSVFQNPDVLIVGMNQRRPRVL